MAQGNLEPSSDIDGAGLASVGTESSELSPENPLVLGAGLDRALRDLLYRTRGWGPDFDRALAHLERDHHDAVYVELLHMLSHLRFEPTEARRHWEAIVAHREELGRRLAGDVDLRVALVSYFVDVQHKLDTPKLIELRIFEQTQASAYRDELTELYNYRHFTEQLERELSGARRSGLPLSLVMLDVDDFKLYNDRQGHAAGNEALTGVARQINAGLRASDTPARYGGEEFAIILPMTPKTGARIAAERVREAVEQQTPVTISLGVATFEADAGEPGALIRAADHAMYEAKASGKNRVRLCGESTRSYRRVDRALEGRFRMIEDESYPLTAVNLGGGGLAFTADRHVPLGSLIDLQLQIPGRDCQVSACGRVVHALHRRDGRCETAVRLVDVEPTDRLLLRELTDDASAV